MTPTQPYTCGILTVSDKGSRGERQDTSGEQLQGQLSGAGFRQTAYQIVPDDQEIISSTLRQWVDQQKIDLIITTGGTGVSPTDLTPEATAAVLDKTIPGISEAMRQASLLITPRAILSRGIAGIRGKSLIINLPGSKKAAKENLETVLSALDHAVYKIKGGLDDCGG
jgi:molybdenum cofactor synthesis domain-containing protein